MAEPDLPPLYYASVANDLVEVRRLLDAGADPNDGESVYHAAENDHRHVVDLLIAHGCDISAAHPVYKNTPVFFLCHHTDDESGLAPWHRGIAYLLERGADPNVASEDAQNTPLHQVATAPGAVATARLLLDHGRQAPCPQCPGHHAVPGGRAERQFSDGATALRSRASSTKDRRTWPRHAWPTD